MNISLNSRYRGAPFISVVADGKSIVSASDASLSSGGVIASGNTLFLITVQGTLGHSEQLFYGDITTEFNRGVKFFKVLGSEFTLLASALTPTKRPSSPSAQLSMQPSDQPSMQPSGHTPSEQQVFFML